MNPAPIADGMSAAIEMYFRTAGRRCVVCSKPVAVEDAKLWKMNDEILLTHQDCR